MKPLAFAVLFLATMGRGRAHAQVSSYEELQAAYIFNFAKYVTWPTAPTPFVIGIYGEVEILQFLKAAFEGKKIAGHRTEIRIIHGPDEVHSCHIIYLPESGSKYIRDLIPETAGKNILVVTEDDLIKRGATISFIVDSDRLKFKLNPTALSKAGLSASEGLLKLAILK